MSPAEKKARGTEIPCRKVEILFKDHAARPDPEKIPAPKHLNALARRLWEDKVDRYRQRGQKIDGFQSALEQYVQLEAELIDLRKRKTQPPMAMVNAHRIWAAEFYDTPASQHVPAGAGASSGNRFKKEQRPQA